jgi:hypothetical protein
MSRRDLPRKGTKVRDLYELMSGGGWYSARQLSDLISHRFGSYLYTLRWDYGIDHEVRKHPACPKGKTWVQYRLVPKKEML